MHILFLHQNYPAQFGHIAQHLIARFGYRCSFVCQRPTAEIAGIDRIQYGCHGGARESTHPAARSFENQIWHSQGVLDALRERPTLRPDLIVAHSGFVSPLFLRELYDCPIISYFEYFYHTRESDLDFRRDLPPATLADRVTARGRNAMLLLDLHNCDAGYVPTEWQRRQLPIEYQPKLTTIFDGIDTTLWRPVVPGTRRVGQWNIPSSQRIVTYVARGMESMRGFDIFMKVAKRVCEQRNDVVFVVVGEDRVVYGGDLRFTGGMTFKQWVLAQDSYDLSRILFVGRLSTKELVDLFSLTDLHLYLTAPFVLSWSLLNALACGATVLASDTAPVREMVEHGVNGLLCDFFDVEAMEATVHAVLDRPTSFRHLGEAGRKRIDERYELNNCLTQMVALYGRVVAR